MPVVNPQNVEILGASDDWSVIRSFYQEHLRPNHPLANRALFDWCFGPKHYPRSTTTDTQTFSIIGAYRHGSLVGHIGALEVKIHLGDRLLHGAWYINIYVLP